MGSSILFAGFPDYLEPQFEDVVISGAADAGFPVSRLRERALYRKARLTATAEWIIRVLGALEPYVPRLRTFRAAALAPPAAEPDPRAESPA